MLRKQLATVEAVSRQHRAVFIPTTLQVNPLPVGPQMPDVELYPLSHTGATETPNHSSVNVLFCRWGAQLRCLCGLVCSDELYSLSLHPAQDWWSGSVTCKRVLRRVAFPAWAAEGQGGPLYDCLRCHIDEGRIGSGLIWVLHHGDVWSSRPDSSSGTLVCTPLWLFG